MMLKIKYQINENYNVKKIKIDSSRNKILDNISKKYLDPMLKKKTERKHWKTFSQKMTQKTIKRFIIEVYLKPAKTIYATYKTDVFFKDDIWSLDIPDLKQYGPGNNGRCRYILVVNDNLSNFGGKPLKEQTLRQ